MTSRSVIQSNLIAHLEEESRPLQTVLSKSDHMISDVIQVVTLALEGAEVEEGEEDEAEHEQVMSKLIKTIEGEIDRLNQSARQVHDLVNEEVSQIRERYQRIDQNLTAHSIIKSAVDFDYYLMTQKQTQVINKFSRMTRALRNNVMAGVTNLYYRRSEGLIAARRFKRASQVDSDWNSRMAKMIMSISPKKGVMEELPFYYKQLFLRPHSVAKDLWLVRDEELAEANEALAIYNNVRSGALLVLGAPLSGKTYLSELVARQYTESERIHIINPPEDGTKDLKSFHRSVKKGLRYYGAIETAFDHLEERSVVLFNSIEQWWERSPAGLTVLANLMNMIDHYSHQTLFIVNMGSHSYGLVNKLVPIEERFFKILRTTPFNAEELKTVILTRHRTSRLKFQLDTKHEDSFSELKLAKLFTKYFDLSEGNVGVALQQWICNIEALNDDGKIQIYYPKQPDREVFNHLDKDRVILLIQFILHRKLSLTRLAAIMYSTPEDLQRHIEVLQRMDLLRRKSGTWEINRFLEPFLIEELEQDLLI